MKEKIIYKNINGTKCYVITKKGFAEKQAMVSFKYGSKDTSFCVGEKSFSSPIGTAHFLEHKLFEDKSINVFDEFSKLGASSNAFTNFNNTAYYFKTEENFIPSLGILLKMVSEPYFTDENVEKEKGIITQEIKMYDDDPDWCSYFNLLKCLYKNNNIRENIAGSISSVNEITKDTLYDCYNAFYTAENTAVVCCGDINPYETFECIEKNLRLNAKKELKINNPIEESKINKDFVAKKMNIGENIFNIGFKENLIGDTIIDRISETKILLDIICGRSSQLFNDMYSNGIADESFGFDYCLDHSFGFCVFSGSSNQGAKIRDMLIEKINFFKENGIEEAQVNKIRKKHLGEFIRGFNSISNIVSAQAELSLKGSGLELAYKSIKEINGKKINSRLKKLFSDNYWAISLIEN